MGIRREPHCLDMAMISDRATGNLFLTGYSSFCVLAKFLLPLVWYSSHYFRYLTITMSTMVLASTNLTTMTIVLAELKS